ncbi:hypothetical protein AAFF_G00080240 [Aldrovandia affinis]|uniref:Uncharacterized protein n=1 Tax=Aldrovandia affinis TaxID=143900 RepID=A0AAD7WY54_9TELE|nr:hypothetical protein AAFF_G00080240 [Aldrovandia affinis]
MPIRRRWCRALPKSPVFSLRSRRHAAAAEDVENAKKKREGATEGALYLSPCQLCCCAPWRFLEKGFVASEARGDQTSAGDFATRAKRRRRAAGPGRACGEGVGRLECTDRLVVSQPTWSVTGWEDSLGERQLEE